MMGKGIPSRILLLLLLVLVVGNIVSGSTGTAAGVEQKQQQHKDETEEESTEEAHRLYVKYVKAKGLEREGDEFDAYMKKYGKSYKKDKVQGELEKEGGDFDFDDIPVPDGSNLGGEGYEERKMLLLIGILEKNQESEKLLRFLNFQASKKRIERLNWKEGEEEEEDEGGAVYGLNIFSDWSEEEFASRYLMQPTPSKSKDEFRLKETGNGIGDYLQFYQQSRSFFFENIYQRFINLFKRNVNSNPNNPNQSGGNAAGDGRDAFLSNGLPKKFDWRTEKVGVVSPIKNQGACGSCWAFSAVEVTEGAIAAGGNPIPPLSTQQVLACSDSGSCSGGWASFALDYIVKEGVMKEEDYPYESGDGRDRPCQVDKSKYVGFIKSTGKIMNDRDKMMKSLVKNGPVGVRVWSSTWQDYSGGVIRRHCLSTQSNHAVSVIGYDMTGKVPYWIVRNSWGPSWGLDGYLYIAMGNVCGVENEVTYATV